MSNRGVSNRVNRHHRGAGLISKDRLIKKRGIITRAVIHQSIVQLHKIIGHAQGFGGVHMGQLVIIQPSDIQKHFCPRAGIGCRRHRAIIRHGGGIDDIAIMQDTSRHRQIGPLPKLTP